jgi:hypothetical protein
MGKNVGNMCKNWAEVESIEEEDVQELNGDRGD